MMLVSASAFVVHPPHGTFLAATTTTSARWSTSEADQADASASVDYEEPDDAVIRIKPKAMNRLRELREKQDDPSKTMILRMGVRNGGCSGLSYVMDFTTPDDIQEDDAIDEYKSENIKCVVDAKSVLYLYGLELDYSEELIGGGFKFYNHVRLSVLNHVPPAAFCCSVRSRR